MWGLGFRVYVRSVGFKVEGLFGVQGLGFGV